LAACLFLRVRPNLPEISRDIVIFRNAAGHTALDLDHQLEDAPSSQALTETTSWPMLASVCTGGVSGHSGTENGEMERHT
jgi:hypothetical protein